MLDGIAINFIDNFGLYRIAAAQYIGAILFIYKCWIDFDFIFLFLGFLLMFQMNSEEVITFRTYK